MRHTTPSPLTESQLALLRRTITPYLTDDEHELFVQADNVQEIRVDPATDAASRIAPAHYPDHVSGSSEQPGSSVPVPLRAFVNRGTGDRKNVTAAMQFLEDSLIQAAGLNGAETFKRITSRLPRTFRTREECRDVTINCWLELWAEVEKAKVAA